MIAAPSSVVHACCLPYSLQATQQATKLQSACDAARQDKVVAQTQLQVRNGLSAVYST